MMCLPGLVSVWLDRRLPARREAMDDSAPEPDKRWSAEE